MLRDPLAPEKLLYISVQISTMIGHSGATILTSSAHKLYNQPVIANIITAAKQSKRDNITLSNSKII
jgi:V8-like Glu-specific endopeptidase